MKLVAISGKANAGKDTFARMLSAHLDDDSLGMLEVIQIGFADPLKELIGMKVFHFSEKQLWTDEKEKVDLRYNLSPRQVLQQAGVAMRDIYSEVWIQSMIHKINKFTTKVPSWPDPRPDFILVSDLRFKNEMDMIASFDGYKIRIERSESTIPLGMDHASETELDNLSMDQWDAFYRNDADLIELDQFAKEVADDLLRPLNC